MSGVLFRLYGQHILLTEYQVEGADSKVLLKIVKKLLPLLLWRTNICVKLQLHIQLPS